MGKGWLSLTNDGDGKLSLINFVLSGPPSSLGFSFVSVPLFFWGGGAIFTTAEHDSYSLSILLAAKKEKKKDVKKINKECFPKQFSS